MSTITVILWIVFSGVAWKIAADKGRPGWIYFAGSLMLTPVVGIALALLVSKNPNRQDKVARKGRGLHWLKKIFARRPAADANSRPAFRPSGPPFKPIHLSFGTPAPPGGAIQIQSVYAGHMVESDPDSVSADSNNKYNLDLSELTCTCKDFKLRSNEPQTSAARLCRHLLHALAARNAIEASGKWEQAIIQSQSAVPLKAWLIELSTAPSVLVADAGSQDWIDVFAHSKRSGERIAEASGEIERHGWNFKEQRWSYGNGPPGSRELTPILKSVG